MKDQYKTTYNDLKKMNTFLKGMCFCLVIICLFTIGISNKDPLIIRESLDKIETISVESSQLETFDVDIMLRNFVLNFDFYNSYRVNQIYMSLNIMTSDLRQKFLNEVFTESNLENIRNLNAVTNTIFDEISFKQTGDVIIATVVYTREIESFDAEIENKVVRLDLVIDILPKRSKANPYGMLISEYKRSILG